MKQIVIKSASALRRVIYIRRAIVAGVVVNGDHLELLDELCKVDGYFSVVVIHDQELKKKLEAALLVSTNARGGSSATALLRDNLSRIEAALEGSKVRK